MPDAGAEPPFFDAEELSAELRCWVAAATDEDGGGSGACEATGTMAVVEGGGDDDTKEAEACAAAADSILEGFVLLQVRCTAPAAAGSAGGLLDLPGVRNLSGTLAVLVAAGLSAC